MDKNKFHCLVVDTTAFINNVPLQDYSDFVITVPEVVKEIKNKRQLKRLCVLPYDLIIDEPSTESVKYVSEFAKKTGDYLSLSVADLKVIALTYQLEKELIGTERLRDKPIVAKTIASKDKPPEFIDCTPVAGFYLPPYKSKLKEKYDLAAEFNELASIDKSNMHDDDDCESDEIHIKDMIDSFGTLHTNCNDDVLVSITKSIGRTDRHESDDNINDDANVEDDNDDDEDDDDDDDEDDNGWITPCNLLQIQSKYGKEFTVDKSVRVACMTTDYAVQNVLKQINLNIAALDGNIIKQMRTYILRCYACFKTTSIMTKIFCPNCGNKTLKRVAISLDENGQQIIHINTRRPLTAKGKNQSIPRPRGGKHSTNPILFEDQVIPKQMPSRVARTKTNALDEDYIAGFSPFVQRDVDSKSALLRAKGTNKNLKQWARNHDFLNTKRKQKK